MLIQDFCLLRKLQWYIVLRNKNIYIDHYFYSWRINLWLILWFNLILRGYLIKLKKRSWNVLYLTNVILYRWIFICSWRRIILISRHFHQSEWEIRNQKYWSNDEQRWSYIYRRCYVYWQQNNKFSISWV